MKIKKFFPNEEASVLVVALFMVTLLAVSVAGYLTYVEQQALLGARSQSWNLALGLSEAGVEEALAHLNLNHANLNQDGWIPDGNTYTMSRTLTNGSYTVAIDNSEPISPVILSRAFVSAPTFARNAPVAMFAAAGTVPTSQTQTPSINRAVRVTTWSPSLFQASMVAKKGIDLKGNGVTSDSFDSEDPAKSTNGLYDATKAQDHGDIASNDSIVSTVSVQQANIYGRVFTGPGGTATVGSQGAVGTHAWQAGNSGFEPGYVLNTANFTFPDTTAPYISGIVPPPGDVLTVASSTTNTTVVSGASTPPGAPGAGQYYGPITTNNTTSSSTVYPGSQAGMTTNVTWVTTNSYPGANAGLLTNCTAFTTVGSYPGAQQCLSTNNLGTVSTTNYPGSQLGMTTNAASTVTTSTNCTGSTTTSGYPATPCLLSGVTTNWNGGHTHITGYSYFTTTSVTSTTNTTYTYTYQSKSYTYASTFTFTYPVTTYTYPTTTYTYTIYTGIITYITNHFDHVIGNADYYATSLSGTTIVTGKGRLVLPNGLNMANGDGITIAHGGGVTIYSGGTGTTIGGNGVMNENGFAGNFIVYCDNSVTSFTLNGNGHFTGVLVAPNAAITMNGGGNSNQDFTGALMVNSVRMNGHFNFHYDEALGRMGGNGRYLITSWAEVN